MTEDKLETSYLSNRIPKLLILDLLNIKGEIETRIEIILGLSHIIGTEPKKYNQVVEHSRELVEVINRFLSGEKFKS